MQVHLHCQRLLQRPGRHPRRHPRLGRRLLPQGPPPLQLAPQLPPARPTDQVPLATDHQPVVHRLGRQPGWHLRLVCQVAPVSH